jgi:hypothetical protein
VTGGAESELRDGGGTGVNDDHILEDVDIDDEQVIRAKWLMDGAANLKEAVLQLRDFAD